MVPSYSWKTPTCQIYEGIHKWHTQNYLNKKYIVHKKVFLHTRHLLFWNAVWNCFETKFLRALNSPFCMRSRSSNLVLAIISPLTAIILIASNFTQGGIQQLCWPNFTKFFTTYLPRVRLWTFYIISTLCSRDQAWSFYWPPTHLFLSTLLVNETLQRISTETNVQRN